MSKAGFKARGAIGVDRASFCRFIQFLIGTRKRCICRRFPACFYGFFIGFFARIVHFPPARILPQGFFC